MNAEQIYGELVTVQNAPLEYRFPEDKKMIARMSYTMKLQWYGYQFEKDQHAAVVMGNSPEFKRFWKWRVLMPMKIGRMYYRIKNFEVFKHYKHISEMKDKVKKHSI